MDDLIEYAHQYGWVPVLVRDASITLHREKSNDIKSDYWIDIKWTDFTRKRIESVMVSTGRVNRLVYGGMPAVKRYLKENPA